MVAMAVIETRKGVAVVAKRVEKQVENGLSGGFVNREGQKRRCSVWLCASLLYHDPPPHPLPLLLLRTFVAAAAAAAASAAASAAAADIDATTAAAPIAPVVVPMLSICREHRSKEGGRKRQTPRWLKWILRRLKVKLVDVTLRYESVGMCPLQV